MNKALIKAISEIKIRIVVGISSGFFGKFFTGILGQMSELIVIDLSKYLLKEFLKMTPRK